jgi:hypothetical protein
MTGWASAAIALRKSIGAEARTSRMAFMVNLHVLKGNAAEMVKMRRPQTAFLTIFGTSLIGL